ncbi:MAG: 30S ribosomal protein S9 [Acidobacteria bacterium]|nr:30S ribosomal protein S9 [Acidobacteriota bacterium]
MGELSQTPAKQQYYGTGRRKTSVARVFLRPGSGNFAVNGRSLEGYFLSETQRVLIRYPLQAAEMLDKMDVLITVRGGGINSQAGAARLGIARALLTYNAELRPQIKKLGLLTRDSRGKERKKYGRKGARKRFQFSKR